MVKNSIEWHRHKGTSYAIIKALEMLGIEAKFTPWYELPDDDEDKAPYTFAIDAKLNNEFWERVDLRKPTLSIRDAIVESKAARSYTGKVYVHFEDYLTHKLEVGIVTPQSIFQRVNLNQPTSRQFIHSITFTLTTPQGLTSKSKLNQPTERIETHSVRLKQATPQTISARMINPQLITPRVITQNLQLTLKNLNAISRKEA